MAAPSTDFDPKRTALLVMDYQEGVLDRLADADELLGRVEDAIADVRAHGGTIGYVRVAFTDDDYASVPATNATFSAATRGRAMHDDDPSTAIHKRLAPERGDIVVRKVRIGAMSTTDLDHRLRARGVNTLVLAGVHTSGVVLSTVIDAADRDYRVFVLADAVADPDPELHDLLLRKVFTRRATVIDAGDLHNLLESAS